MDNRENREDCNENQGGDSRDGQRKSGIRRIRETRHEERTEQGEEQDAHNRCQHGSPAFALETQVGADEEENHEHEDARGNRIQDRRGGGHQRWHGEAENDKAEINEPAKDDPQGERLLPYAVPNSTAPLHRIPPTHSIVGGY